MKGEHLQRLVGELRKKSEDYLAESRKCTKAIEGLQAVCEHEWVDNGHDSHYNYEKCTFCGKQERC